MKNKHAYFPVLILALLLVFFFSWNTVSAYSTDAETQGSILFVKPGANGTCSSWEDACELQTALFNAVAGDQIWVSAGTYKPTTSADRTKTFQLKSGVAMYGGFPLVGGEWETRDWENNETIFSGDINSDGTPANNSYHVVTASGVDAATVLDGFTITGGNANSAYPDYRGGGMLNTNFSSPSLTNLLFQTNYALEGGGLSNLDSNPILTNVTFLGNSAEDGGGMSNLESSPELTNVTFLNNTASDSGGGLFNGQFSHPSLSNVTFTSNSAARNGGLYNYFSNPRLTNVVFSANSASWGAGGMGNETSNPTLYGVTFDRNAGSGMYNSHSNPTLLNVTFSGNTNSGMVNITSNPVLRNVSFTENIADRGGGMYNKLSSNPDIACTTFSNNSAVNGGGMFNDESSPILTNVTFSGNSASEAGGGMYNYNKWFEYNSSFPKILNATFTENSALIGGGIYNYRDSKAKLTNAIIWWNSPDQIYPRITGDLVSFSDVQSGYPGTGNIDADPLLSDLIDNGGFTLTHALELGSPAINSGAISGCPTNDQRGYIRPIGRCDMGAYEYGSIPRLYSLITHVSGDGSINRNPNEALFQYGELVKLSANATPNWKFSSWSEDASGSTNPLNVIILGDTNITAIFVPIEYNLSVNANPPGSGTVTRDLDKETYNFGNEVLLTAKPSKGWIFESWTGDVTSTDNPLTVTIEGNTSITANFTPVEYDLSVTVDPADAGSVTLDPPQGPYHYGDVVTLTPTANPGYTFSGWSGATVTDNQVTITGNTSITATFTPIEYSLSVTVDPTGSGSVLIEPLKDSYHYGDVVTLTPIPEPGYTFSGWTGATVTDNQVTIEGDITVIAVFTKDTFGIFLPLILR
jgi:uncharacterized repeat protein (TIGR02543 family)